MNLRILVISYKMNFLGEALIRTLPRHLLDRTVVVHNGKSRERASRFQGMGARQVFWEGDDLHSAMLDHILVDGRVPEVTDGVDWVICMDHDLSLDLEKFLVVFLECQGLASTTTRSVIAFKRPRDPNEWIHDWSTIPFFWVRPSAFLGSGMTWRIVKDEVGKKIYDTGQMLYHQRPEMFELVGNGVPDVGLHFSGYWSTHKPDGAFLRFLRAEYADKLSKGLFCPSQDEWAEMEKYPAFSVACTNMRTKSSTVFEQL